MQWPNEKRQPVIVSELDDEKLTTETQRLVDAHRQVLHDGLRQLGIDVIDNYKMVFTGRAKALLDECKKRDIEINVDRVAK